MNEIRKMLCTADIHDGSGFGLETQPRKFLDEQTLKNQRILTRLWGRMCATVKPDVVLVLGDLCEGWNPKEKALYLSQPDRMMQVEDCIELLKMIRGEPDFKIIEGSQYHVDTNPSMDALVAKGMQADFSPSDMTVELEEGTRIHLNHLAGYSAVVAYRTTFGAREQMAANINEDTFGPFDLILRAHTHYHVYSGYTHQEYRNLPCWKVRDPYASKKGLTGNPKVGWIVYDIFPDGTWQWNRKDSCLVNVKNQIKVVKA